MPDTPTPQPLLPADAHDKLASRLHQAVSDFVDEPRAAVEEADHVVEEVTARLTDAVAERHRTLRSAWQPTKEPDQPDKTAADPDTEQLRLALRDYRALAERLLRL